MLVVRGCVGPDTVAWFDSAATQVAVPGAAFVHIPLPEFLDAWRNTGNDAKGGKFEAIGCPRENTRLFEILRFTYRLHSIPSASSRISSVQGLKALLIAKNPSLS